MLGARVTLEERIDAALCFGRRMFAEEVEALAGEVAALAATIAPLEASDPALAARSYETLLAACDRKLPEVDDHYLALDYACTDVVAAWLRAREAAGADPEETARRVLERLPLGRYSPGRPTPAMLSRPVLAALVRQLRARPPSGEPARRAHDALARQALAALGDEGDYVAYAGGEAALGPDDCRTLATMLQTARPERALVWLDRALALDVGSAHGMIWRDSVAFQRSQLLVALGRAQEALDLAWASFEARPRQAGYGHVLRLVPESERPRWHARAMEVAAARGALEDLVLLWDAAGEHGRLAERLLAAPDAALDALCRLDVRTKAGLDPRDLRRIAARLAPSHPEAAAKLQAVVGRIGRRVAP